jgi:3-deoxy-D-manno-octulosonic-acid transferase
MNRWVIRLYNLILLISLPLIALYILLRWRRRVWDKGFDRWPERWAHYSDAVRQSWSTGTRWWWVHAVSLGEVKAIEPFLRRAPAHAGVKVLLSVVTPEAIAYASAGKVADIVIAAPIDLPWVVRRAFRVIRPVLFLSVESEFWPNLLRGARESGARVALINGRLSARSFGSYQRVRGLLPILWDCFDLMAVRQEQDRERFEALGVSPARLRVTGNMKFDVLVPMTRTERKSGVPEPVVVFGSTREGEEAKLLPAVKSLQKRWPGLHVIWAPRHLDRLSELEGLLQQQGESCRRKSSLGKDGARLQLEGPHVLWDSMGDLLDAYRRADVAVVGGSFVPKGGQNPIEPATLSIPVVFGPSMDNFYGIAEALVAHGGARQVELDGLSVCLDELLSDAAKRQAMGQRAREAVEQQQGATERTLVLLEELTRA